MTIENIKHTLINLGESKDIIDAIDTAKTLNECLDSIEAKYHQGFISYNVYQAYCYLWRNRVVRYSNLLSHYQL